MTCIGPAAACTPEELATFDLWQWRSRLSSQLVDGNGEIESNFDPVRNVAEVTVRVTWRDMAAADQGLAALAIVVEI